MIADAATATQIVGVAVVVLTLLVTLGSSLVVRSKTNGLSESVTALETGNAGLRGIISDMERKQAVDAAEAERKRVEDAAECDRRLHAQEVEYTAKISVLTGRLEVLTGDFAKELIAAAVEAARIPRQDEGRRGDD